MTPLLCYMVNCLRFQKQFWLMKNTAAPHQDCYVVPQFIVLASLSTLQTALCYGELGSIIKKPL